MRETIKGIPTKEYFKKYMTENGYNRKYYVDNKDAITARQRQKQTCACGRTVNRSSLRRHLTSVLHMKHLPAV